MLIPEEYYKELQNKYGNKLFGDHFIGSLEGGNGIGDLGKTNVRGVITGSYTNGLIAIVRDWTALYPIDYSTDDGRTFTRNKVSRSQDGEQEYNIKDLQAKIDKYPDAKFALAKLISTGVIENPFENYRNQNSLRDTQEFEEGYFLVTLKSNHKKSYFSAINKKLISMRGFDETYGVTENQGKIVIPVIIGGKKYFIQEDNDGDFYIYKEGYKNSLKFITTVQTYDEEFDNVD